MALIATVLLILMVGFIFAFSVRFSLFTFFLSDFTPAISQPVDPQLRMVPSQATPGFESKLHMKGDVQHQ